MDHAPFALEMWHLARRKYYDGCLIRGLPIGVPFKTKFFIPEDRASTFENDEDIFIILRFQNMHGNNTDNVGVSKLSLTDSRGAVLKSEMAVKQEETFQNITDDIKKDVYINDYSLHQPSDKTTEEAYSEERYELQKVYSFSADTNFAPIDDYRNGGHTARLEAITKAQTVEKLPTASMQRKRKKKVCSSPTDMKFATLDVNINEDHAERLDTLYESSIKKRHTVSEQRRRKGDTDDDLKARPLKPIENESDEIEGNGRNRRKSSRIRSAGVRPDYLAIEEGNGVFDVADEDDVSDGSEDKYAELILVKEEMDIQHDDDDYAFLGINLAQNETQNVESVTTEFNDVAINLKSKMFKNNDDSDPDFDPYEEDCLLHKNTEIDDVEEHSSTEVNGDNVKDDQNASDLLPERTKKKKVKRKKNIKQVPKIKPKRIKIKLEEHRDKYRVGMSESFARKDRGKSKEERSTEMLICTICEKFRSQNTEAMENHIECHINGQLDCDQCDFKATYTRELNEHKRQVHKNNITVCFECGEETNGEVGLKNHLGKIHGKPQFHCKYCKEENREKTSFITLYKYNRHMKEDHADKLSVCTRCNGLYRDDNELKKHLRLGCEGERPKLFQCSQCDIAFGIKEKLTQHIYLVHKKVKRFQCPHCSYNAACMASLRKHSFVHTGVHPYRCDQCSFTCIQCYQLTSHKRTHTGEKPYKCTQCNYAAAWKVQLKDHVKVHSITNTVTCQQCGVVLKHERAFKMHQKKEHTGGETVKASNTANAD